MTHGVLIYLVKAKDVLLVQRADGPNPKTWNGLSAIMGANERAREAAIRIGKDFTAMKIDPGEPLGMVTYHHPVFGDWDVTVFRSTLMQGSLKAGQGVTPKWFDVQKLPFTEMWPGDHLFVYRALEDKPFTIEIWFDEKNTIVKQHVEFA